MGVVLIIPLTFLSKLIVGVDVGCDVGNDVGCEVGANLKDVYIPSFALFVIATSSCPELDDAMPAQFLDPAATVCDQLRPSNRINR